MAEKYQKISVSGLLVVEKKVLVVRRSLKENFLSGYYELPGGKVDFGEVPEEALKREFMEEVNLKIIVGNHYKIWTYISDKGNRHTVDIVYLVKLDDKLENLRLNEEHDDFKLISKEEIDKLRITDEKKEVIREGFKIIEEWKR